MSISKDMREDSVAPASCGSNEVLDQESEEIEDDPAETSTTRSCLKWKATVIARMKIKNWLNLNENILLGGVSG